MGESCLRALLLFSVDSIKYFPSCSHAMVNSFLVFPGERIRRPEWSLLIPPPEHLTSAPSDLGTKTVSISDKESLSLECLPTVWIKRAFIAPKGRRGEGSGGCGSGGRAGAAGGGWLCRAGDHSDAGQGHRRPAATCTGRRLRAPGKGDLGIFGPRSRSLSAGGNPQPPGSSPWAWGYGGAGWSPQGRWWARAEGQRCGIVLIALIFTLVQPLEREEGKGRSSRL